MKKEIEIYAHYELGKCVWMKIDGVIYKRGTPEFEKYILSVCCF